MTDSIDPKLIEPPYPLQSLLGMSLTAWSEGKATVEAPLAEKMRNRQGLPHGGVHATLLDSAMGYAGCYTGDPSRRQMALTLSLTVNYVGIAKGSRLIATAHVTGGGRKTYFCDGELTDDLGTKIATATGVFKLRSQG
jgi:uncharacterized protein (TIGR00369 family)